jgi:hypothetical protein
VYDCVTYLVWQYLSLQWLRAYCRSGGRPPESHDTLGQRKTCVLPRFTFEGEDSYDGTSISGASNGGATFFYQTRLGFDFDFGLTGSFFLTCSSSLFSVSSKSFIIRV